MPHCFVLYRKGEQAPAKLGVVDRELCQNLGLPFSDDRYASGWFDTIGLALALGRSFNQIVDGYRKERDEADDGYYWEWWHTKYRIACYLAEHYTSDAWREFK